MPGLLGILPLLGKILPRRGKDIEDALKRRRYRLRIEQLEDRIAPSTSPLTQPVSTSGHDDKPLSTATVTSSGLPEANATPVPSNVSGANSDSGAVASTGPTATVDQAFASYDWTGGTSSPAETATSKPLPASPQDLPADSSVTSGQNVSAAQVASQASIRPSSITTAETSAVPAVDNSLLPPTEVPNQSLARAPPTQGSIHQYYPAAAAYAGSLHLTPDQPLTYSDPLIVRPSDSLTGNGVIHGSVVNNGTVSPGNSPGLQSYDTFTQGPTGTLVIQVAGNAGPGITSGFDQVRVTNLATLDGTLKIELLGGFVPAVNDKFDFLTFGSVSGDFAKFQGLAIGNGLYFKPMLDTVHKVYTLTVATIPGLVDVKGSTATDQDAFFTFVNTKQGGPVSFGGSFTILGQTISGQFSAAVSTTTGFDIRVTSTGALQANLGDGNQTLLSLTMGSATFQFGSSGFAGTGMFHVSTSIGGASLSGTYALQANLASTSLLSLPAGPYFRLSAMHQDLTVGGQKITADYTFETKAAADGGRIVTAALQNATVTLSAGASRFVQVTSGQGNLIIQDAGIAGSFSGMPTVTIPHFMLTATSVLVEFNTEATAVDRSFDTGGQTVHIAIPGGPFVRVEADGAMASITAGSTTTTSVSGDFTFDQDLSGASPVTRLAVANLAVTIGSAALNNGRGAFVVTSDGVAGFVSGAVSLASGPFSLGADVGLRVNTTPGMIHQVLQLNGTSFTIDFTTTQGNDLEFFASGVQLNIGNFVSIQGSVAFQAGSNGTQVFGGDALRVFLGQGPLTAADGSANPAAQGVLLNNARVGLIETADGKFALDASGDISLVGIAGVTFAGHASARFNNTGAVVASTTINFTDAMGGAQTVTVAFPAGQENVASFAGDGLTLTVLGQSLSGSFAFSQSTTTTGEKAIGVAFSNVQLKLSAGTTDVLTVTGAQGAAFLTAAGLAGKFGGTASLDLAGLGLAAAASGSFDVLLNTTGSAVDENAQVGGTTVAVKVPAGPYLRVEADNVQLSLLGQVLTGNFVFEKLAAESFVRVAATNLTLALGDGQASFVTVTGGQGALIISSAGIAGSLSGTVAFTNTPSILLKGSLRVDINTTGTHVQQMLVVADVPLSLDLEMGHYVRVVASGVQLSIGDQTLTGDFAFEQHDLDQGGQAVTVALSNVELDLGDANNTFVTVSNGSGLLVLNSAGVAGTFSGTPEITIPTFSLMATTASVAFSTEPTLVNESFTVDGVSSSLTLPPGPFVRVSVVGGTAMIAGNSVTADFTFEQGKRPDGSTLRRIGVANLSVTIPGQTLQHGQGAFVITSAGIAGFATGTAMVAATPFTLGGDIGIRINTTGAGVNETVQVNGATFPITFAAAQGTLFEFFASGASLKIGDFVSIEGNVAFQAGPNNTQILGGSSLKVFLGQGPLTDADGNPNPAASGVVLNNATIGLVKYSDGSFALDAGGDIGLVGIAGVVFSGHAEVRFNNTGKPVQPTPITFTTPTGTQTVTVGFDVGEENLATFEGDNLRLSILGQTLSGNFVFSRTTTAPRTLTVAFSNVHFSLSLGGTDLVTVTGASGVALLNQEGLAGAISATVGLNLAGLGLDAGASGSFSILLNTRASAVAKNSVQVGTGSLPAVDIPAGPYLRVEGQGVRLNVLGNTLSGDFLFEESAADQTVRVSAQNVMLNLGDGANNFVTVNGGQGALLLTPAGLAGTLRGMVQLSNIAFNGTLQVGINTTNAAVHQSFVLAGDTIALDLPAGPFVRVTGTGVQLTILNQKFTGDLAFEQAGGTVTLAAANVQLTLGDTAATYFTLTNGQGLLVLTAAGIAGSFSGTPSFTIPHFTLTASSVSVAVNTGSAAVDQKFTLGGTSTELQVPAGPFVRVQALDVDAQIPGQIVHGDFLLDQGKRADMSVITRVAVANLSVMVNGQGLDQGQGGFVVEPGGVAGVFSGRVSVQSSGFQLGGSVGLRFNNTGGAVDEMLQLGGVTIPVHFGANEGNLFAFSASGASLKIGDFVSIEGDVTFQSGDPKVFGGNNLKIFLGQGPVTFADGSTNPAARGVLLTNAKVGLIEFANGTFALDAEGDISLVGIAGVTFSGSVTVRFNNTGSVVPKTTITFTVPGGTDTHDVAFAAGEENVAFFQGGTMAMPMTLSVLGQTFSGIFSFGLTTQTDGNKTITVAFTEVSANIGVGTATNLLAITHAQGVVLLNQEGLAGKISATAALNLTNLGVDAGASGSFDVQLNSRGSAVQQTVTVAGTPLMLDLHGGPYLRVEATGVQLTVLGQSLSGDFVFEKSTAENLVRVTARNVQLTLGDGSKDLLTVTNGQGQFTINDQGIAGTLSATVALQNVPNVSLAGTLAIEVNTTSAVPADNYVRVSGTGVHLGILGQTLTGDFQFTKGTNQVDIAAQNVHIGLGDGTTELVMVNVASATLHITAAGIHGSFTGDASVNLPNVDFTGNFTVDIDTTAVTPFVHVSAVGAMPGTGATLTIAGQSIKGDFSIEQMTVAGSQVVRVGVDHVSMSFGSGTNKFVSVTDGSGSFIITRAGVAADFTVTVAFPNLPSGVTLTGGTTTIQLNTLTVPVDEMVTVGMTTSHLVLPAGPFVRVQVVGAMLGVGGTSLSGSFVFDQQGTGSTKLTRLAASNLMLTFHDSGSSSDVGITNGQGAFVVTTAGVAGMLSGDVSAGGAGFSLGGNVGLRINTSTDTVDQTIDLNGQQIHVFFDKGETASPGMNSKPFFQLFGSGLIQLGDFLTLEGSFSAGNTTLGVTNATLFFGQGPPKLPDGSPNPNARGVLLSNATVGVVKVTGATTTYAVFATGVIGLVGIAGVSFSGTATIKFNNTGQSFVQREIPIPGTSSVFLDFPTTDNVLDFSGTGLTLNVAGQTLTGNFSFLKGSVGTHSAVVVKFDSVHLGLGDGTNELVSVDHGAGQLLLTSGGLAGTVSADVSVAASTGVTLDGSFGLAINTTGTAVDSMVTLGASTVEIQEPAGPFIRVISTGVAIEAGGQKLTGDFTFEQKTENGAKIVTITFANVGLDLGNGLVTASGGNGTFILTSAGLAGQASVSLAIAPSTGIDLHGNFLLAVNTTSASIQQQVDTVAGPITLMLPAGPFVRIEVDGATLTVAGQSLTGDFLFQQQATPSGDSVVTVAFANAALTLASGGSNLVTATNGNGVFLVTSAGLAGEASANIAIDPSTGISLSGTFKIDINTTSAAVSQIVVVNGTQVSITLPAGPFVEVVVRTATLTVAGFSLTADEIDFRKSGAVIALSGRGLNFEIDAGSKRIIGLQNADFAFTLLPGGIAGAALHATLLGPNFGGNIALAGSVSLLLNSTSADSSVVVDGQSFTLPAATAGGIFLRVELTATPDGTPATLEVLNNKLTADRLLFEKNGADVFVAVSELAVSIAGQGLNHGTGAFIITPAGVAGFATGSVAIAAGLFSVGGDIGLRVNTTGGPIHRTAQVGGTSFSIDFNADQGNVFEFFASNLSLKIGDFVSIEGSISFQAGDPQVFGGNNLRVFLGQGPLTLPDGSMNPSARGVLLNNARIGLVKFSDGTFALDASGDIALVGITGVSFSGPASVRFNNSKQMVNRTINFQTATGMADSVQVEFDTTDDVAVFQGGNATTKMSLSVLGQTLSGIFLFNQTTDVNGQKTITVAFQDVQLKLGTGGTDILTVTVARGVVLLNQQGVAGQLTATAAIDLSGLGFDGNAGGTFDIQISTRTSAVQTTVTIAGNPIVVDLPAGPYLRVEATGVTLSIQGQTLSGDFLFEKSAADQFVRFAANNVHLALGDGTKDILSLTNGQGAFIITPDGIAGTLSADVALENVPNVTLSGMLHLEINETSKPVHQSFILGGVPITLDLDSGSNQFIRVAGTGVMLTVTGVALSGDFTFTKAATELDITAQNIHVGLGDGTTELVTVNIATAALTITSAGIKTTTPIAGDVTVNVPGVQFTGNFTVSIDTTIANPFVSVSGHASLMVAGQSISGDFALEQTAGMKGQVVRVGVTNVDLAFGPAGSPFVHVIDGSGSFILSTNGVAASFMVTNVMFPGLPSGITLSTGPTTIQVNTFTEAVNDTITVANVPVPIVLPPGPFVRVEVDSAMLGIGSVSLMGNFVFDQQTLADGSKITRIAASHLQLTFDDSGNMIGIMNGQGAFALFADGVAGMLSGDVSATAGGGLSVGGNVGLRINSTTHEVHQSITLNGEQIKIDFGPNEFEMGMPPTPFFQVFGKGLIQLGDFLTLEGSLVASNGAFAVSGGTLFFGRGPPKMADGSVNPGAQGVELSNASVGLQKDASGTKYAVFATGTIQVIGIPNVTFTGKATIRFNNTGQSFNNVEIPIPGADSVFLNFPDTSDVLEFRAQDVTLNFMGQALSGNFSFVKGTVGGKTVIAVQFDHVHLGFGDGSNELVTVNNGTGTILLTGDGVAGMVSADIMLAPSTGVSLQGSFSVAINTTGAAVNSMLTVGTTPPISIVLDAGPFVRVVGTNVSIVVASVTLTGDFSFEQRTSNGSQVVTVTFAHVMLDLGGGLVTARNGTGTFLLTSAGLAGQAAVDVTIDPSTGIALQGSFSLAINTASTAVNQQIDTVAGKVTLSLPAGPYVRVQILNTTLTLASQTFKGDFLFEKHTTPENASVVTVAFAHVSLALSAGGSDLVSVTNGAGVFIVASGGVAGTASADVSVAPSTGVSLSGTFKISINSTNAAVEQTFDVNGQSVPLNLPAGPFVRVVALNPMLSVAGFSLTADEIDFQKADTFISVSGSNLDFVLNAGTRRIIGFQNADFTFRLTQAGIAGAALHATLLEPDFGGSITLAGTISFFINTTTTQASVMVDDQTITLQAATATSIFLRVELSKNPDGTPVTLTVLDNSLTADELDFEKSGTGVSVSGTNVNFLLQAGGHRIVGISNADFAFRFSQDGIAGAMVNAQLLGPDFDNITLTGTVSLLLNTTPTAVLFHLGASDVMVPGAPAGSSFVRVEITGGQLSVFGNTVTADKFVLTKNGTDVTITGLNLSFELKAGTMRIIGIQNADFFFQFTAAGIYGAVLNGTILQPQLPDITLAGTLSVMVNTTTASHTFSVGSTSVTVAAAPAGGSLVRGELDNANLTILGNALTAGSFVFEKNGDMVSVSGTGVGFLLQAGSTQILKLSNADFSFAFTQTGVVGALLHAAVQGPDLGGDLTVSGDVSLLVNTTTASATLTVGGTSVMVPAPDAGTTFLRVEVKNALLSVLGNSLTADRLVFEKSGSDVTVTGDNVSFILLAGSTRIVALLHADFGFRFTSMGFAGALANAQVLGPDLGGDIDIHGTVSLLVNTIGADEHVLVNGVDTTVPGVAGGKYLKVEVVGGDITILGAKLTAADFTFESTQANSQPVVNVSASTVHLGLGDGTNEIISVDISTLNLTFTSTGISGSFMGDVTLNVPNVNFHSMLMVEIDTTSAAKFVRVTATGIHLTLAGQMLMGDFVFEQVTQANGDKLIKVAVNNVALDIGDGTNTFVSVSQGQGVLLLSPLGFAGTFSAKVDFNLPSGLRPERRLDHGRYQHDFDRGVGTRHACRRHAQPHAAGRAVRASDRAGRPAHDWHDHAVGRLLVRSADGQLAGRQLDGHHHRGCQPGRDHQWQRHQKRLRRPYPDERRCRRPVLGRCRCRGGGRRVHGRRDHRRPHQLDRQHG
jgi:hypothetical protein